ncbi:MAG TPA: Stp1/IreP family PP2C-type Ser/Thr phosphatase [Gemmatimonadales bacterium]|jgi:protein phosphatase|nr:Stp1/IreP family PP2C-type Ser/Thr phosphatase [Gemmatimonadales bacterium]
MRFSCAARTDVGVVRSGNEDAYLMASDRGLFIVADGMGGHAAGEVASDMAKNIIAESFQPVRGMSDDEIMAQMVGAIRSANEAIFRRTLTEHDKRGMGTTTTVLNLLPRRYLIGQVGDSRAYLLRGGVLTQLTKDHSYVQEQVDAGRLTPEEARVHPYANVITRCVGSSSDVVPDLYVGTLEPDDLLLLASDGLTGMLDDADVREVMANELDLEAKVDGLIAGANRRGGLDNITTVLVRIEEVAPPTGEVPAMRG